MMGTLAAPIALFKDTYHNDSDKLYQVIVSAAETLCTDGTNMNRLAGNRLFIQKRRRGY